jgi:hypothetical protein
MKNIYLNGQSDYNVTPSGFRFVHNFIFYNHDIPSGLNSAD